MGRTTSRGADEKLKLMSPSRKEGLQIGVPKQLQRVLLPACAALLFLFFVTAGNWSSATEGVKKVLHKRPAHFPRKIWQTWKVDPMRFEERDHNTAQTWIIKNPDYRYEVLTDQNDLAYVETHFGPEGLNRPDIVFMYRELTARIIKADLLRYMIMYVEGGIYTDIDVEALKPANHFIPQRWNEKDVDMVIGVEIDQPEFKDHPVLGSKSMSFCQWTFMTKPRLPVMLTLIENIMMWLRGVAMEQNKPISQIELDFDQVISGTGPSAFTKAILADMSKNTGRTVTWDEFHDLNESKLVGGVLVLTVEAFAAGQGHSDSGTHEGRQALVRHHYHASGWPTAHPRFNHPMFGEVERCNWVPDCVRAWDENTATWEHMTPEDKMQQLEVARTNAEAAQKQAEDAYREAEAKGEQAPPPPPPPGAPGAPPLAEFLNPE
ncbi:Initiation-specific alpha-1,6-mannosyltransferase [Fulvia fulva]|uniref:Initiation-specific alpha-1,6-mannosyltransferase n=1 Tax=Passalora fulva TaxID=5499 RepID=A0A9Q8LD76_PASFU|nr:Initiation-specific alpha-1,6-mannosyltransferase [Fulvia fulva]KAK4629117.1 Initiation-specific alpha-1,6-mannosyltransferase [Fulvia fulva]KAK4630612.1 Initiation-specific alpha-1,6-mannosyltransferase [Fulvia fulva]UJO15252.1 Initiation-specific alpha-1,6-mannosyltransferase [Fulvia fulva]WPV12231.1 Initiation-specific alpha-1,6-mannosyltransferase [Fulvia fulva]WPV27352.1 Initiation-specific alpha-1,6-mannosyltransferase [Fulvia fulva]